MRVGTLRKLSTTELMFLTTVLEKTLESPLDSKIKPVSPKGNQPWTFIRWTEAEATLLRPSDAKSPLTGKDPDAGKDWRQEEKGTTEDVMVGRHHRLRGHEFELTRLIVEDGEPGVLQSTRSQRAGRNSGTEQWQKSRILVSRSERSLP